MTTESAIPLEPVGAGTPEQPDTWGCDLCSRQEYSGIINGTHTELIPMFRVGDVVLCEDCLEEEGEFPH